MVRLMSDLRALPDSSGFQPATEAKAAQLCVNAQGGARPARADSTEIDRSLSEDFTTRACNFLPPGTSHS